MTVMSVLLSKIKANDLLETPIRKRRFIIESISPSEIVLLLGKKGWKTPIPAECWNGIPDFLRGKEWIEIGSIHGTSKPGTLEDYVDGFVPRSAGTYVSAILEYAGLVKIDRVVPSKIRLI